MEQLLRVRKQVRTFLTDETGQDLIEYALMAGFVAVTAGALMPGVSSSVSTIWSKVSSSLFDASNTPNG